MPDRKPMVPLTEREMRMLLSLIEAEQEQAERCVDRWEKATDPEAEGVESLDEQRMYALGFATGVSSIKKLIENVLNA